MDARLHVSRAPTISKWLIVLVISLLGEVSSFTLIPRRTSLIPPEHCWQWHSSVCRVSLAASTKPPQNSQREYTWAPQDLTKDNPGYLPIPDNDYVKQYQRNPHQLWPVEFFLVVYRRTKNGEVQLLVRPSANGTAKYGVGTGVPVTRWLLSTAQPPQGYQWTEPSVTFEASNFPEFPKKENSWTYGKIDILRDAFSDAEYQDDQLEEYAKRLHNALKTRLSEMMKNSEKKLSAWEMSQLKIVKNVLDKDNSVAAVQGTLRMSGLFARRTDASSPDSRYISLDDNNAPDPDNKLAESVRIYTMFPQMPNPMPLPNTPPKELQEEIHTRPSRMAATGRDPHKDVHGRIYTHISTSNVSNTIMGVYLTLDATEYTNLNDVPALNLFDTTSKVVREWKSLEELQVLVDGKTPPTTICTNEDPKPIFLSEFIVRQLVQDGVIAIN